MLGAMIMILITDPPRLPRAFANSVQVRSESGPSLGVLWCCRGFHEGFRFECTSNTSSHIGCANTNGGVARAVAGVMVRARHAHHGSSRTLRALVSTGASRDCV